jgi:two-component system response regulator AtoC
VDNSRRLVTVPSSPKSGYQSEDNVGKPDWVVGNSHRMAEIHKIVERSASTNATILITGETGTGKEVLARYIQRTGSRAERPFVKVNCAGLPDSLMESELFGHDKGAFTGAVSTRIGRFEMAHTGTIFLDEVGELSLNAQAKLLRILQEKEFERLGSSKTRVCDVRVIAATNRDLLHKVSSGSFREDLYYRLAVIVLCLPPLRERSEDIGELASCFLQEISAELEKSLYGFSDSALKVLKNYPWPGNIRELRNIVHRAAILSDKPVIDEHVLQLAGVGGKFAADPRENAGMNGFAEKTPVSLEELEKRHISLVLQYTNSNRSHAATILNVSRKTLLNKIKRYGLG